MFKNKVVFVVTSEGRDLYSELTRIAIESIRITNPLIEIILCCDIGTYKNLEVVKSELLNEVDLVTKIDIHLDNPIRLNRFIKITLPQYISAPFLYLDSDVIIRGDITPIFGIKDDIALSYNHSLNEKQQQIWSEDQNVLDRLSWSTKDNYYNGGVIYYGNESTALEFSYNWYKNWIKGIEITDRLRDQPSLNYTLLSMNQLNVHDLDFKYNHQFIRNYKLIKDSVIWHYYSAIELNNNTKLESLVKKLIKGSILKKKDVGRIIHSKSPYKTLYSFRKKYKS